MAPTVNRRPRRQCRTIQFVACITEGKKRAHNLILFITASDGVVVIDYRRKLFHCLYDHGVETLAILIPLPDRGVSQNLRFGRLHPGAQFVLIPTHDAQAFDVTLVGAQEFSNIISVGPRHESRTRMAHVCATSSRHVINVAIAPDERLKHRIVMQVPLEMSPDSDAVALI